MVAGRSDDAQAGRRRTSWRWPADPEDQRDIVRLVVCDSEVGKPVLIEIRDGQVHRILAGGTGPRHIEATATPATQPENAFSARHSGLRAAWPIISTRYDRPTALTGEPRTRRALPGCPSPAALPES